MISSICSIQVPKEKDFTRYVMIQKEQLSSTRKEKEFTKFVRYKRGKMSSGSKGNRIQKGKTGPNTFHIGLNGFIKNRKGVSKILYDTKGTKGAEHWSKWVPQEQKRVS